VETGLIQHSGNGVHGGRAGVEFIQLMEFM